MTQSSISVSALFRRAKGYDPLKAATQIVLFTAAVATVLAVLALAEPAHASTPVERTPHRESQVQCAGARASLQHPCAVVGGTRYLV